MDTIAIKTDEAFEDKLNAYPKEVKERLDVLRNLILEVAVETDSVKGIQETLKWGEPSFLTKVGSTLRMDWKAKNPNEYALYFKCTSKLVLSFREVYGDFFKYEKNRAILFDLDEEIPVEVLKDIIRVTLEYHKVKEIELLGLSKY